MLHDAVAVGLKQGRLLQDGFRDGAERPVLIVDGVCGVRDHDKVDNCHSVARHKLCSRHAQLGLA